MDAADRSGVKKLLAAVPLGLLAISLACDVLYLTVEPAVWGWVGYWDLVLGLAGGVIAGGFAVLELWLVVPATPAGNAALARAILLVAALALLAGAFSIRTLVSGRAPTAATVPLAALGLGCAGVAAWRGGRVSRAIGA